MRFFWRRRRSRLFLLSVMKRPDLDNRRLTLLVGATVVAIALYFLLLPSMPEVWRTPGSPQLYLMGVSGAALLLMAASFSVAKRGKSKASPVAWFAAHVNLACVGTLCIAIHSVGYMRRPPALLILALVALAALGIWARIYGAQRMAATMGTKRPAFGTPDPELQARLRGLIERKQVILAALDPAASEALFSPNLSHWLRNPARTWSYLRLVREEEVLIGARESVGRAQAYWRAAHLSLAALFVVGLFIHVITVTFFAGYVADGGEIYWWHLTKW